MQNSLLTLIGAMALSLLFGCNQAEVKRLSLRLDSLEMELRERDMELQVIQDLAKTLEEARASMDSIKANRQWLRTDVVEGTEYENFLSRLQIIQSHIENSQDKIGEMEGELENSMVASITYRSTVQRLKIDLESDVKLVAGLEEEVERKRAESDSLKALGKKKDALKGRKPGVVKMKQTDVDRVEKNVKKQVALAKRKEADRYYKQGLALEASAAKIILAPKKKRETLQEALELFKISLYLGNEEAKAKVEALEKIVNE